MADPDSMIKAEGNLLGFFARPIAAVLGVVTLAIWAWVILAWLLRVARGRRSAASSESAD